MNNKTMILSLLAMASVDAMAQRITAKNEIVDCGSVMYETDRKSTRLNSSH